MPRILPVALFFAFLITDVKGQQLPLYTQYMFNPYLINPSMVAYGNQTEVNALYRRQWTAIKDGPKTMQFDAQLPLNGKMAIGLNVYNDQTVLLSATSALVTFGYKVQLATDHQLGFGLSAGVFTNRVNLKGVSDADATDPALLNGSLNNTAFNGQFGAHYMFKNFTLGYSLVNLVDRKTVTPDNLQAVKFGELKNQILFASYRFNLSPVWYLQPNIAYRTSADNLNYYEASAFLSYNSIIALGGGYRENFGPSAMVRLTWKQLQAGFAYDFPSSKAQVSTGGTQEVQLKWRFGKTVEPVAKKKPSIPSDEKVPATPETTAEKKPAEEKPAVETQVADVVQPTEKPLVETTKPEVVEQKPPVVVVVPLEKAPEPVKEVVPPTTYYFVVGTFENEANVQKFRAEAKRKGIVTEVVESSPGKVPHYYYVHIPQYKSEEISLDKLLELQKTTGFKEAWFTKKP